MDGTIQLTESTGKPQKRFFSHRYFSLPRSEFLSFSACIILKYLLLILTLSLLLLPAPVLADQDIKTQRIISLSPGITEILFAIGAGPQVVGVTDFCNYPEAAIRVPRVGGLLNPSYETMITLQPDLIIHQKDSRKIKSFAEQIEIQSLPVLMLDLEGIFITIQQIGDAVQRRDSADRLVEELKDKLEGYQNRLAGVVRKSVLLLLADSNDPIRDLYAVGRRAFLGKLLELAGGKNVLPDSMAQYPKVTKEFILQQSPEIIIEAGPKANLSRQEQQARNEHWSKFPSLRAVKDKNIYFIGADYILIPGPRLVNIVGHFARVIHPELFSKSKGSFEQAGATKR